MRKIPLRKCLATGEQLPKKELVDLTGKMNGRGAYLKKSKEAFEIAKKKKLLARSLQVEIPDEIFEELGKLINE